MARALSYEQKIYAFEPQAALEGLRLAPAMELLLPDLSSRQRVLIVTNGLVQIDGRVADDLDHVLTGKETLRVDLRHGTHGEGRPKRPPLIEKMRVLHDEVGFVVVNKASGVLVQPVEGERAPSPPLVELLKHYWKQRGEKLANPVVVQRLDRGTSGVMVLGKTTAAGRHLQRQAAGRYMERRYLALVEGSLRDDSGTWRSWLKETDAGMKQSVAKTEDDAPADAKEAITHYTVRERLPGATLLELRLETGRQHQIRIHCAEAGHPVAGDSVYMRLAQETHPGRRFATLPRPKRMMLHAARLKFQHPYKDTRWMTFSADPDESFLKYVEEIRSGDAPVVTRARRVAPVKKEKKGPPKPKGPHDVRPAGRRKEKSRDAKPRDGKPHGGGEKGSSGAKSLWKAPLRKGGGRKKG